MKYRELYEEGVGVLSGLSDAKLDARLLLEHVCDTNLQTLLVHPETEVSEENENTFRRLLQMRAGRKPLAYITGNQDFMGLTFTVSEEVLIPNQDTENLVEEAMRIMDSGTRVLDLCTGSGCILLSLLHYSNGCTGVGTDISGAALEIAAGNAENLGLSGQTRFLQGDLFEALEKEEKPQFDLIVSNPPYIPTGVIAELEPEVGREEPLIALDGGEDGLYFYRKIAEQAADHLVIGGVLMMEIGFDQGESVPAILREHHFKDIEVIRDYGGNDRIVRAYKGL